jgi:predicted DNA-binding transcriptional regulator AlpA
MVISKPLKAREDHVIKLHHRGKTRYGCPACLALDEALLRLHSSQLCMSGKGHLTAADLLRDISQLKGACAATRRAAIAQLTVTAAAIASYGTDELVPEFRPEKGDRVLDIAEAAAKTGLTRDALYRRKDLPFRVRKSAGRIGFSEAGIERWIFAKTANPVV